MAPRPDAPLYVPTSVVMPAADSAGDAVGPWGKAGWGPDIQALAELNTIAAQTDAVFVTLSAQAGGHGSAPAAAIRGAARAIESKGTKLGLFKLAANSADYERISAQAGVPAVLVLVKGRGAVIAAGEITEAKLLQAFVAAARAGGGGCCPGGAPASGASCK